MARPKGIRGLAEEHDIPLSDDQVKNFRVYGLLPDRDDGEVQLEDLDRLRQIRAAKARAFALDRRLFYLHDPRWPIPIGCVRRAANEVAQKIQNAYKKNRALYRCLQVRAEATHGSKASKSIPSSWRLPNKPKWSEILAWPNDDEFDQIYVWCRSEIRSLAYTPGMRESEDFNVAPYEEMLVLLLLHQLSLPPQNTCVQATETTPWP